KEVISKRFGHFINVEGWWDRAKQFGKDEKAWLDERKIMSFEQLLETQPWNN
ncbi:unnamed protein product, partial [marine sediment metagenome]